MSNDLQAVQHWLQSHRVKRVCVVSPHLDDAAFSLATFLQLQGLPERVVTTVFTQARLDSDDRHSKAMGFANPVEEYEARRQEDRRAMAMMKVGSLHAGAFVDRFTAEVAVSVTEQIKTHAEAAGLQPQQVLVLLPVGAGGHVGSFRRMWCRLRRRPAGCAPHAEHEWVRDGLLAPLRHAGMQLGYYAEVPYIWADEAQRLQGLVHKLTQHAHATFSFAVNADQKLAVIRAYHSQYADEFGDKEHFQRRTVVAPELLFLPA